MFSLIVDICTHTLAILRLYSCIMVACMFYATQGDASKD